MKACFQIAECSFSSTKILQTESRDASLLAIYAEVQLFFYKDTMIFAEVIYKKRTIICKTLIPQHYSLTLFISA